SAACGRAPGERIGAPPHPGAARRCIWRQLRALPAAAPVRRAGPTDRTPAEPASTTVTTGNPATSTSQGCARGERRALQGCAGRGPEPPHHRSVTAADGLCCPGQSTAGAFGQGSPRCSTETGMAAGDLTDGAPHAAREGAVFCITAASDGTERLHGSPGITHALTRRY